MADFKLPAVPSWLWLAGGAVAAIYVVRKLVQAGGSGSSSTEGGILAPLVKDVVKETVSEGISAVAAVPAGAYGAGASIGYGTGTWTRSYIENALAPSTTVPTSSGGYSQPVQAASLTNTAGGTGGFTRVNYEGGFLWMVDPSYVSAGGFIPNDYTNAFTYMGSNSVNYYVYSWGPVGFDAYSFLKSKRY